ncbi:MAG TPA: thiol peroxidase [Nitrospira sp.]|nr:thiol peroxidase [Nitrospira sp.]
MRFIRRPYALSCLGALVLAGCSAGPSMFLYKNYPVAEGSATAGDGHKVLSKGGPLSLSGNGIKVGDQLRSVKLAQPDNTLVNLTDTAGKGKVRIISVVPSLDTKVCEQQTHYLSEKNKGLDKMIELITVSIDTPFAQRRFADEANIANVTFLSDFRNADFGRTYGLLLKDPHILARAVMVVDAGNTVRHLQITPDLGQLPDMDDAFQVARKLVTTSGETLSRK